MKREPESEAKRWLLQAKYDLNDADFSFEGERFNLACFLSQQAAEKALKAYLIANKKEPWGHSVAELCEAASVLDEHFKNIKKRAATLDIYYIPTRYPNGLPGGIPSEAYQNEDAQRALSICNEVIDLVEKKIGKVKNVTKNTERGT
jgi:HEPN domain-containing protein